MNLVISADKLNYFEKDEKKLISQEREIVQSRSSFHENLIIVIVLSKQFDNI